MKKWIIALLLMLALCAPALASTLMESAVLQFEKITNDDFVVTCDYFEDGNVACMQMVYQLPYLDIRKLFQSSEEIKTGFQKMTSDIANSFYNAVSGINTQVSSVVCVISNDNIVLAEYINGQDVSWMKTNWDGLWHKLN